MRSNNNVYAVYKGDDFIDLGTLEELSQRLGIKKKSLTWYTCESAKKKRDLNTSIDVFKIEDDEEESE